jgi:uncharacterized membrane protein
MTTDQPNLVNLLRQLRDDTTTLVREEVSLAKTEMSEKVSTFSRNAALLAVGGFIGLVALMMLLLSLASLLTQAFLNAGFGEGMAGFLGLFIIGAIVAVVSGVLIAKGLKTLKGKTLAPEKTIETLKEDKAWAQRRFA